MSDDFEVVEVETIDSGGIDLPGDEDIEPSGLTGADGGADWDRDKNMTTPPVDLESVARARAHVESVNDSIISDAMEKCALLRDTFGDKDEAVATIANDLMAAFRMVYLEFSRRPGRVLARIIRAEADPAKAKVMIEESRRLLDQLDELIDRGAW